MPAGIALVVVGLVVGIGGGLLLYGLVREAAADRAVMDRTVAERTARRDSERDPP